MTGINVLKNEKDVFEVHVEWADEGLGELLVRYLNEEKGIKFAAYRKEHPFDKGIELVVKAADAKKTFLKALKKVKDDIDSLDSQIAKV